MNIERLSLQIFQQRIECTPFEQIDFKRHDSVEVATEGLHGWVQWQASRVHHRHREVSGCVIHCPDLGKHGVETD